MLSSSSCTKSNSQPFAKRPEYGRKKQEERKEAIWGASREECVRLTGQPPLCPVRLTCLSWGGVKIHNPNTDSILEFGGLDTAEERKRCARGARLANGQPCMAKCGTQAGPLSAHVCHTCPTWAADVACYGWSSFSLS
ncbi:hypothetical protein QYF36_025281 [Acer negundo]|nr:hypothetical protein QYF36_025281 [Acer negundo]